MNACESEREMEARGPSAIHVPVEFHDRFDSIARQEILLDRNRRGEIAKLMENDSDSSLAKAKGKKRGRAGSKH